MNSENRLLTVLATEQDILDRIVTDLDTSSLRALDRTCQRSRDILRQFFVWERIVERHSEDRGLVYDWGTRMNQTDYQEILTSLENLDKAWTIGPVRTTSISLREIVVDVVMDEADIAVATTGGTIKLFSRLSNTEQLSLVTDTREGVNKLGLSTWYIISGHHSSE